MLALMLFLCIVFLTFLEVSGTPHILHICLNRYLPNKYLEPFRNIFYETLKIPVAPNIRTVISCTYTSKQRGVL